MDIVDFRREVTEAMNRAGLVDGPHRFNLISQICHYALEYAKTRVDDFAEKTKRI